ncbi:MAG TPA: DUF5663 domain-containing protein [Candidatus Paceibacterota bacterium]|nr:DUF5663 domain-containing protein [Candidatus Paceibacterota bacterium]
MITELLNLDLVAELGLNELPEAQRDQLVAQMKEALDDRITGVILENLSEEDRSAFDTVLDSDGDLVAFLEERIPNLHILIAEVVAAFKGEMLELQEMVEKYRAE